ncbi:cell surface glycoprotein CD200 receptor 1-B [Elysia marginata]|uniref:Cell surface glycoprotein CD200 receptor 1-B n=1 Tax=Elysia marginata TaxID=1093978 RepID=A0AAV4IL16_9GAST|nr:cell surface glycoprotein CD200 receptor 1-B [Elysia marginata]
MRMDKFDFYDLFPEIEIGSSTIACRIGNSTDSCRLGTSWTAYCTARLDEQIEWRLDQEYDHERVNISEQVRAQNCERNKCPRRISQWYNTSDNTFVSKLEIDELHRSDFGDYTCQVLNFSSGRYILKHRGLDLIPRTMEARLNENFVFLCKASVGAEANESIEWFMKHRSLPDGSTPLLPYYSNDFEVKTWEVHGEYTSELRITRLTPKFLGIFWCTTGQLRSLHFELQLKNTTEGACCISLF